MSRLLEVYPAFENRSFRLLFWTQLISFTGTWLQIVAQGWLVFEMTHSALLVGLTAFLVIIPTALFALLGGAIADRFSIRTILTWTTWLGFLQAAVFGTLFASGHLSLNMIYALSVAWGILNGIDSPARYAGITKMVKGELIASAMALNSILVNIGFMAGPAIAGNVIAKTGIGTTFFVNAVSFLPMAIALTKLDFGMQPVWSKGIRFKPFAATIEGMRYASSHAAIGFLLAIMGAVAVFGISYRAMLPVVAHEVLHVGPQGFGWLSAAPGIGALVGGVLISWLSKKLPVVNLMISYTIALGISLVLFSEAKELWLAMAILVFAGLGFESVIVIVQSTTAQMARAAGGNMIGRVMGLGAGIFFGGMAIGNFVIGYAAERMGTQSVIRWNGWIILCLAVALLLKRRKFIALIEQSK